MKVRADAVPLAEPLAGGVADASVVVEPMGCGTAVVPPAMIEREPGLRGRLHALGIGVPREKRWRLPVPAFLVRHPGVGAILVDTGLHPSVASDPRHNLGRIGGSLFELEQGRDAVSQLRPKGVSPADVAVVVMTHLHLDHASAISEFPESLFVVSSDEWREATEHGTIRNGYRPVHYDHAFDYCSVDFDSDAIESYGPFGRTFDLLGDGSVRLVFTPGHSAGHMSVICRLPRRDFVICGDVAHTWRLLEGRAEPGRFHDLHNWHRSAKEMRAYREAYPYALVVPGHDPEFWPKLDARYEQ
ncbi:MAG: N-acyl homoserine lactonase family protein [Solirubrobacterales bacterium]